MTNVKELSPENKIKHEAAAWIAKLDSGEISVADKELLQAWVARSPKHRRELYFLANMWDDFDEVWIKELLSTPNKNIEQETFWQKSRTAFAMAATITLFTVSFMMTNVLEDKEVHSNMYTSQLGSQKEIALVDGSTIILNTASQVEILFSKNARKVRLLKGEALFEVVKDKSRPFIVYAGNSVVRAVGTAFLVQRHIKNVEVTVTEGRVELSSYNKNVGDAEMKAWPQEESKVLAQLDAGQYAEFNTTIETIASIGVEEIEKTLSWLHGQIIFDGEPLDKVVADINRYSELDIIIADPQAKNLLISGYFSTSDIKVILNSLHTGFDINVEYNRNGKVYLTSKQIKNKS